MALVLLYAAWTLTVEYYDGFEYLLTARALLGSRFYFFPKNPAICVLFAAVALPFRLSGLTPDLRVHHIASLLMNLGGAALTAAWIRAMGVRLSAAGAFCVLLCSRLFVHYAAFSMSDLPGAFVVAAVFWTETRLPLSRPSGILARAALLASCLVGRLPTAAIPLCALLPWFRKEPIAALETLLASVSASVAVVIGVYALGAGLTPGAAIQAHAALLHSQFIGNFAPMGAPAALAPGVYAPFLVEATTVFGSILVFWGAFALARDASRSRAWEPLTGAAVGLAAYLAVIAAMPAKEMRYLAPLLPVWAYFQCLAIEDAGRVGRFGPSAALLALFISLLPEAASFRRDFFTSDPEKVLCRTLVESAPAARYYFSGPSVPFSPPGPRRLRSDPYFERYDWGVPAFVFFSGKPAAVVPAEIGADGWPAPVALTTLPIGATHVLLPDGGAREGRKIRAYRREDGSDPGRCLPSMRPSCVSLTIVTVPNEAGRR